MCDVFFVYFDVKDGNFVIVMFIGIGKSVIIVDICIEIIVMWNG